MKLKSIKHMAVAVSSAVTAWPVLVSAHVKWFAQPGAVVPTYKLTDGPVIAAILLSLFVVLVASWLEKKVSVPEKIQAVFNSWTPYALSIATIGFGLALIIFSISGFVFAPNMPAADTLGKAMLLVQFVAGMMLLFGVYERLAGWLVLALFSFGIGYYGPLTMLDAFEMAGVGLFAIIIARPKWKLVKSDFLKPLRSGIEEYGVPILRIATGFNLLVLGFSEKILNPGLAQNFLMDYQWNFMQMLGFEGFVNYWFVLAAGTTEALFGLVLMLGLVTRITTTVLAVFLITTLVLLGPVELIGHLPHFSIAVVLFVIGAGNKWRIIPKKA